MRNKKLTRRGFLSTAAGAGIGGLALPAFPGKLIAQDASDPGSNAAEFWDRKSTANLLPRKVVVGTVMQPFWGKYPGLDSRLRQLTGIVDRVQTKAQKQYGRSADLIVLPEMAITGEGGSTGEVIDWSFPLAGPVQDTFAKKAREYHCYIVAPLFLCENKATKLCSNAAVLFGRKGEVVGIYRKVHPVVNLETGVMEHGVTAGKEVPVFDCDFGKLGIQICFDINFDYGWDELSRKGADIVVWPTQSPQRVTPSSRALRNHYYIVSSTWRDNATVFDPIGKIVSQVQWDPSLGAWEGSDKSLNNNILVQEIDLSYAIIAWSPTLGQGKTFTKAYGNKAGFRYYDDDDRGIFWSNDPQMTVRQMLTNLNQVEEGDYLRRTVEQFSKSGIRS